jgi:hypothetical protein
VPRSDTTLATILTPALSPFASINLRAAIIRWHVFESLRRLNRPEWPNVFPATFAAAVIASTAILVGLAFLDQLLQLWRHFQSLAHSSASILVY